MCPRLFFNKVEGLPATVDDVNDDLLVSHLLSLSKFNSLA